MITTILWSKISLSKALIGRASKNANGTLLQEFCATNNLVVIDDPSSEHTFKGDVELSWIDLTIVRLVSRRLVRATEKMHIHHG